MKGRWRSILWRVALAAVIVACGVRYAQGLDGHAIWAAAAAANPWLLALSALGNLPLVWCKSRRMNRLLDGKIPSVRLMGMYFTSYAADNLVMSQAGLGLRVAFFKMSGVALATAAAVQGVEKAVEALGLGIVAGPVLWMQGAPVWLRAPVVWTTVAAVVLLLITMLLLPRSSRTWVQRVGEAAGMLRRPRTAFEVAGLTALAWVIEALMVIAALGAMHFDVPMVPAAALVLLAVNMAALVPGLPGNLGTFEVSCTLSLRAFHVSPAAALSFALLYHAMHTIPVTLLGLLVRRRGYSSSPAESAESDDSLELASRSSRSSVR